MGVYSSNSITKHINFYKIIKEKGEKYPFVIFNINRSNRPGTQWRGFLDIYPNKDLLLFNSFDLQVLNNLLQVDLDIIHKMLFNLRKSNKNDSKINLVSIESYQKMKGKSLNNLTNIAKGFFHLLSEFGKLKK